jgi:hypothetical protein
VDGWSLPTFSLPSPSFHTKGTQMAKRNYAEEYRQYHKKPEQVRRRAARNASRSKMVALGKVKKGDGKDVDHVNHNPHDRRSRNLRVLSKAANRAKNRKGR